MKASPPVPPYDGGRSEIFSLTGLRFVAALYVFVFHTHLRWPLAEGPLGNVLTNGAAGMTLFFVLSGYVLSYQYSKRKTTWQSYAVNRFARIAPVYFLAALMTLPWLLTDMGREGWPLGKLVGILLTNVTATQAWVPSFFRYWNNGASWSISAEAFFYAMFLVMLPLICRIRNIWIVMILAYLLCNIPGLLFGISGFDKNQGTPIFYAMPIFRVPEFIVGMCLQRIMWRGRYANLALLAATALLVISLSVKKPGGIYVTNNWFVVPLISIIILSSTRCSGWLAGVLGSRLMVALGKSSYCFYSFQFFVLLATSQIYNKFVLPRHLFIFFTDLLVLLLLSFLGYRFVEEPARRWIQRRAAASVLLRSTGEALA